MTLNTARARFQANLGTLWFCASRILALLEGLSKFTERYGGHQRWMLDVQSSYEASIDRYNMNFVSMHSPSASARTDSHLDTVQTKKGSKSRIRTCKRQEKVRSLTRA